MWGFCAKPGYIEQLQETGKVCGVLMEMLGSGFITLYMTTASFGLNVSNEAVVHL